MNGIQGWACVGIDCDEDAVLYFYLIPDERLLQPAAGMALCLRHFDKAMHEAVLLMTDDHPELDHVIVSRP
jgi:hypothetical protein